MASSIGFDYPDAASAISDLEEELDEMRAAQAAAQRVADGPADPQVEAELGDVLFAVVNVARKSGVDAELALRAASRRFRHRVETAERLSSSAGVEFASLTLDQQDTYFDRAKVEGERRA